MFSSRVICSWHFKLGKYMNALPMSEPQTHVIALSAPNWLHGLAFCYSLCQTAVNCVAFLYMRGSTEFMLPLCLYQQKTFPFGIGQPDLTAIYRKLCSIREFLSQFCSFVGIWDFWKKGWNDTCLKAASWWTPLCGVISSHGEYFLLACCRRRNACSAWRLYFRLFNNFGVKKSFLLKTPRSAPRLHDLRS